MLSQKNKPAQASLLAVQDAALGRRQAVRQAQASRDGLDVIERTYERQYVETQKAFAWGGRTLNAPFHGAPVGAAASAARQRTDPVSAPQRGTSEEPETGSESALLTLAKSQSRFREVLDQETGEIQRFSLCERRREYLPEFEPAEARLESFALQAAAREILKGITKPAAKEGGRPRPRYRVCNCLRGRISGADGVTIVQSALVDSVRFSGLQTCGSVWHCKVCATRVSEVRKLEIREAVDTWLQAGHQVLMVTYTFPHGREDDLRVMLRRLFDVAWNRLINHRAYKRLREALGYVGRIRAVEVTWGEANGWHPHVHEIWFVDEPMSRDDVRAMKNALFDVWRATAIGAGFKAPNRKRGVDVQGAESAADYIAKFGTEPRWEVGKELAKSHVKKSRDRKGKTPFDLLRDYAETGSSYAADLWREYAVAFAGQVQLYWSQGLKDRFAIKEMSDEQIAAHQEDEAIVLASITWADWKLILRSRDRGLVLELARAGGSAAVDLWLVGLRRRFEVGRNLALPEGAPF